MWSAVRESVNELCEWMVWCKPDYSFEDSAAFVSRCAAEWNENKSYSFVIFDREDDSFLGSIGLNGINHAHKLANVGYWVRHRNARRGVATAATRLVAWFGLRELGLERLEILVPTGNVASLRVAQKAGARFEGILRNRLVLGGKSQDAVMYSIVADDLPHQG